MKLFSNLSILLILLIPVFLSSCSVVEGIFKAGMIWAFILIGLVVALILYFVVKSRRK